MKILLLSVLLSSTAFAQVSKVDIKNFNFNYSAPLGEGTADSFSYEKSVNEAQKVKVEKVNGEFKIVLEGVENQELSFKDAPSLINDAETISLRAFNLSFADRFGITISSGVFKSSDKSVDLNNFNLACDRTAAFPEVMDQLIAGCIQKMNFKAGGFSSSGEGFDQAFMKGLDASHDEVKAALGVKNVDFKVTGGKFEMAAEIKAQISGKVKGSGTVKYEQAAKKLTVKVSEIKFGILDVTSQVFDELKKQESDSIKVSKPYVYITIK